VRVLVVALIAAVFAACGPSGQAEPSAPAPTPVPSIAPQDLAEAILFRTTFGLRADEAWIRRVAADPDSQIAVVAYSVPLTPAERRELDQRSQTTSQLTKIVASYGAGFPDEWAGLYIDQQRGGTVVAQFKRDLAAHQLALWRLVNPLAALEVRQVRWSLLELEALAERVKVDAAWFPSISATWMGGGIDVSGNAVNVRVATGNPAVLPLIEEHFGARGQVSVKLVPPPWVGPFGTLRVIVVDAKGRPVEGLSCIPRPDDPSAFNTDLGWSTGSDGVCVIQNVGATDYWVELWAADEIDEIVVVGRGRVTVPPDGEGRVPIVLTETIPEL
jgi:hypothetical protein